MRSQAGDDILRNPIRQRPSDRVGGPVGHVGRGLRLQILLIQRRVQLIFWDTSSAQLVFLLFVLLKQAPHIVGVGLRGLRSGWLRRL